MKRIISIILLLSLALCLVSCGKKQEEESDMAAVKKAGVVRVGMECDYAPFNWMVTDPTDTSEKIQSGGYADGYDVYFSRMVAEALGVEVEVVKLEWEGLTLALEAGTIDLIIAGMSPTPERKVTVDFTDPYYIGEKCIIVRKDSQYASAKSLEDFSGALITHQHNNAFGELIDQIPDVTNDDRYSDTPRMVVAVESGEVDGFVDEVSVGMSVANSNPDLMYVVFEPGKGFVVDESDAVNAIGCRKGSDLVELINGVLAGVSEDERLKLMEKAVINQPNNDSDDNSENIVETTILKKGDLIIPLREVSSIIEGFEPLDHRYIEFAAEEGTDIIASYDGVVISADYIENKGYYALVEHEGVIQIMYAHMRSSNINIGDTINQGDVIGQVGPTGDGRDPSLEFKVFVPSMGLLENQIDPMLLLPDNLLVEAG